MIYKLITFLLLIAFAFAAPLDLHNRAQLRLDMNEFKSWMSAHGKTYESSEMRQRFSVFRQNLKFVREFDGKFQVAMNKFGDLSKEEFGRLYKGMTPVITEGGAVGVADPSLPDAVDWRSKGVVTAIKDQGQCGSCWSFSTTGSTEGAKAIKSGQLISLSEQQLVDCSDSYGNQGCNGGLMDNAFKYMIAVGGLERESDYPYTAQDGTCQFDASKIVTSISSYTDVDHTEAALQAAVANVGPVSIAIDAGESSFQFYSGGVYSDPGCSPDALDHGVLAVGYGTASDGTAYWLVKNSWGTDWGLSGYIWMARNDNNMCGIASMPSYPIAK
jgi:cathepsin L